MTKIKNLANRIDAMRASLAKMEAEFDALRLAEIRKVDLVKNERSYTLLYKGRRINAARGNFGRLKVTENKKVIVSEFFGSVHDLRCAIALGYV